MPSRIEFGLHCVSLVLIGSACFYMFYFIENASSRLACYFDVSDIQTSGVSFQYMEMMVSYAGSEEPPVPMTLPCVRKYLFGGYFRALTTWNALGHIAYSFLSLVNYFFGTHEVEEDKVNSLQKIRDHLFATIVFPVSMVIGPVYWILKMVVGEVGNDDATFPPLLDHVMHTYIVPAVLIDLMLIYHHYPTTKGALGLMTFYSCGYVSLILTAAYVSGGTDWVYSFLGNWTYLGRSVFISALYLLMVFYYFFGEYLRSVFWRKTITEAQKKKTE